MTAALEVVAPTDAQLSYIATLCREHGFPVAVVYSKQDASLTIDEIRAGTLSDAEYAGLVEHEGEGIMRRLFGV